MKKTIASICLMCFCSVNTCSAISEVSEINQTVKNVQETNIIKKDPKIIKLPSHTRIDQKAFKEKLRQDEKEYQKVRALASNYTLYIDEDGNVSADIETDEKKGKNSEYEKTKNSWTEGYYLFYKTADRIIRANNLDTQNWRFLIDKKTKEVNAYASSANLVTINSSMADSFYDNEDALAWLIGHEMSHHILGHIPKNIHAYERIRKLNIGLYNSWGCFYLVFPLLFIPPYEIRKRIWYKRIRQNETEADIEALSLMAKAGYNVDYANDVLSSLAQLGETEKNYKDTHPMHSERIMNINKQIALLDIETLRIDGEKNLYEKPVMKMKRSSDRKSIVLVSENNRGTVYYSPITPQQKIIEKAYSAYLKDDMQKSAELFENAYKIDKKNYIPCLYLSYINEYNYKKTKNEEYLKKAYKWSKRAYKKRSADKNTIKQKLDIESIYALLK